MIKTMLGETCGMCKIDKGEECFKSYLIEGECGRFWVSEKELKRIQLPSLGANERKEYDEIMMDITKKWAQLVKKGIYLGFDSKTVGRYSHRTIEAIIKGGYNKW